MRFSASGFGDTAEEAIKEWKDRVINAQGKESMENVKTWLEDKSIPKPVKSYGRRWTFQYEEKL